MKKVSTFVSPARLHRFALPALALATLIPSAAHAATLYWDTNGATTGAGTAANGNWNTTAGNNVWSTSAAGDVTTQVYALNSDVVFAAGNDMTSATVNLTGATTANSIIVQEGSLATTGTATLTVGNGGITVNSGVGTVDIARLTLGTSATPATVAITMHTDSGTAGSTLNLGSGAAVTRNGITLFRGNNLGANTAGTLNSSNVTFTTAPTMTGAGTAGTTNVGVITQSIGDSSSSGSGSGFVTYDTNGVRLLTESEYSSTLTAGTNVKATSALASSTITINSLLIGAGGGITGSSVITISSGEVLATGGANTGITAALNTSGTLSGLRITAIDNLTGGNINGGGTVAKYGSGTASFNTVDANVTVNEGTFVANGGNKIKGITVNGGTMRIGASDSILNTSAVTVNTGSTLELASNVSDVINGLSGAGALTGALGSSLGVGGNNGSSTFSGTISNQLAIAKSGSGTFTFSGGSTSSGNVTVSAGTYSLASTGSLTFYIGANNTSNKVTGAGTATFNGTFAFDLTNAALFEGNSWTIADVTNQSFSGTFAVSGFTDMDADNIWTNGAGLSFSEATGILSYSAIPEPSAFALFGGLASLALIGLRRRRRA